MEKNQNRLHIGIQIGFFLAFLCTGILYGIVYNRGSIYWDWDGFCVSGFSIGIDRFRALYGCICSLIWFVALVWIRIGMKDQGNWGRFYVGTIITYLATMGIFYSNHLIQVYILFEVMSICSYLWVVHRENLESNQAARTYLFVSVISGLVMLMGVIILYCNLGNLTLGMIKPLVEEGLANGTLSQNELLLGACCLLFGFGAKAGAFPMHFYLHSAYPATPAPAAAILSAALTKAGIYGILILTMEVCMEITTWAEILLILGVLTMLWNAILGLFQMDLMKILACSSVSQLGFILVGCGLIGKLGEENALAIQGTVLYMVNHSLFKLILFLACGYLCNLAGSRNLKDLAGIGRKKKILFLPFLTGCAGLAGIPLFSGYISKTLLHEAIVELIHLANENPCYRVMEWLFLIAGGCTFAYVTKIMYFLFVQKTKTELQSIELSTPKKEVAFLYVPTILSLFCGILPKLSMNRISDLKEWYHMHEIAYFSQENLKGSCISIAIGCVIFFGIVKPLLSEKNRTEAWKSLEQLVWEPLFSKWLQAIGGFVAVCFDQLVPVLQKPLIWLMGLLATILDELVLKGQKAGGFLVIKMSQVWEVYSGWIQILVTNKLFNPSKHWNLTKNSKMQQTMQEVSKTTKVIQASLSFGFLMICFGLCLTLLYLLF